MQVQEGDRIFVSGATGSIGEAAARLLYERGLKPLIGYHRNEVKARQLAQELDGEAVQLGTGELHLPNPVENESSPITGIVLAASPVLRIEPLRKLDMVDLQAQWDVNVGEHFQLCQALINAHMKQNRRGVVVGVLSDAMGGGNAKAAPQMGAYTIAKYGLLGLMKAFEAEYAWLRFEPVSLGYTETSMLDAFDPRFLDMMRKKEPNQRFSSPQEAAAKIVDAVFAT
ncbi:SDR family oxidoreductase [Magnetovibrio sp. PR-2]|uniref:SDR family NAD(P)-dependent oxidoreductase n=1 Tax=Magnetovibrio sp. PR-2 TaxID=3120356 RepID=UPI002FCE0E83